MAHERIPTDEPIRDMWTRFGVLESVSGCRRLLERKADESSAFLSDDVAEAKSQGVAFCIRSAREYFRTPLEGNLTSRSAAYYYGTLSLLQAVLLGEVTNELALRDVETFTLRGHGLMALTDPNQEFRASEKLGILSNGFLPRYLSAHEYPVALGDVTLSKRYEGIEDIEPRDSERLFSVKNLLARIPELRSVYVEVLGEHPHYVGIQIVGHSETTRVHFPDAGNSPHLTPDVIRALLNWPATIEIDRDESGFRTVQQHRRDELFADRNRHSSVLAYDSYVLPLLGISDVLIFDFMLLYALSIWARYRPALWREIIEGELDRFRALVTAFLRAVARVVPNIALNRLYGREFLFAPFSYWS